MVPSPETLPSRWAQAGPGCTSTCGCCALPWLHDNCMHKVLSACCLVASTEGLGTLACTTTRPAAQRRKLAQLACRCSPPPPLATWPWQMTPRHELPG